MTIQSDKIYQDVFNQAEQWRAEGKLAAAFDSYRELLAYRMLQEEHRPGLPFTINEFYIVDRLADISLLTGNSHAARHLLKGLSQVSKSVNNRSLRIHTVTKLLLINLRDGDFDAAQQNALSLQDITGDIQKINISVPGLLAWEQQMGLGESSSPQEAADQQVCLYDALAQLLMAYGRFSEALLMLQRGIDTGHNHPSPLVASRLLPMQLQQAAVFLQQGDVQMASVTLQEATLAVRQAEKASGLYIRLLDLQSRLALAKGDMGEAYQLLTRLIAICQDQQLTLAGILASFNLAQTQVLLNQVQAATGLLQDCLFKANQIGNSQLAARVNRFLQLAEKRFQTNIPALNYIASRGRSVPSLPATRQAIPKLEQRTDDYAAFFQEKALLFQLYLSGEQPDKSFEILTQLRLFVKPCDSLLIHHRLQVLECMQLYFTGMPVPASFPVKQVIDFFQTKQLLPELWQFRYLVGRTNFIPPAGKMEWDAENQRLLQQVTASLPPVMQALYLLNKWSPNEEFLMGACNELLVLKQQSNTAAPPIRWVKKWRLLQAIHAFQEETNRYKDLLAREIANGRQPGPTRSVMSSKGMLKKLWRQPKDRLTISFLVLPDRLVVIARSFLKLRVYVSFINRIALRSMVFSIRDLLYPAGKWRGVDTGGMQVTDDKDLSSLCRELKGIIQLDKIVEAHGPAISRIRFIPDDVLHSFPFPLLQSEENTLVDRTCISVSITDSTQPGRRLPLTGKRILLAGMSKAVAGFRALPGVLAETTHIRQLAKKENALLQTLLNEEATVEEVKKKLPVMDMAFFCCHGVFNFLQPDQSGLVLAGGEIFSLKDILQAGDLSNLQLVVLSSCRGAEHFILPGRWVIGLPETFSRAGVQAILSFLWPVADDFAAAFTSFFYQQLNSAAPAVAFQQTIQAARNRELAGVAAEYWKPPYWAGAVLYER